MESRRPLATASIPFPHLGMGTWGMGGKYNPDENTVDISIEVLRLGLSLGLRIIDTAELYGAGLCETIVGKAIGNYPRDKIFLISKVWKTNLRYNDVMQAAEGSLKRLQTSYIDLYLIHWPNKSIPISETMRAMKRLVQEGIVKSVGVSNFSIADIEEAQQVLDVPLAANQIDYSVVKQGARTDVIPYCIKRNMAIIAYRPLARGAVAGVPVLNMLAEKYGKTVNQIALNWLLTQGVIPIPATLNPEHLKENIGALDFTMSSSDTQKLCIL